MRILEHPVLTFDHSKELSFTFEGRSLKGFQGDVIASALHANGIRELREHHGRPQGFFCAIGNCSSCLMEVDGVPNVRICVEPLREGMMVRLQQGNGSILEKRHEVQ